ncbi:sensor histidine kinase [Dictyobacter arantiisoli]|uniref:histidine kinase n=1 Tax=Dictyobacter arantiisoli TaxID=2014874 RepID=A0A5A5TC58_9CHLR|nr:HAMP domain-containing sensor histidine kinase [Dictyobacter arantiisoli]GCF08599.1 two-component sensor histidine kinase [Dictyobacter arantiisoli]
MINAMRHFSPPGLRLQLTLWYTIVSSILMLIFCIAFYSALKYILFSSFDSTLQQRAQHVAEAVNMDQGKLVIDDMLHQLPELTAPAALMDSSILYNGTLVLPNGRRIQRQAANTDDIFVRVFDTHAHEIYQSNPFDQLPSPSESISQPLNGTPWRATLSVEDDQSVRVYSTMLVDGHTVVGVVQVGQSLESINLLLNHIILALFIAMLVGLGFCALGSYWLSGRAFRSIHQLTRTALEINANDLHQRVLVPAARDEVRDLSIIFNQMIARLERAFVQQRRLVADASHELRTPVSVIRNMTEIALTQAESPGEYKHVLSEVNAESEHLGHLINDLLVLARADEGQIQLDSEPVRLDLLALDVVESLAPLAQEQQITLKTEQLLPATVLGDAARLIQVIISLVDNALNYSNRGGTITLSVEIHDAWAYLHVTDDGIGIAPEDIGHIFERFYRADPARTKALGGSGLGLSIVEWMVQAHKGTVEVKSQPDQGSTFTIILPLASEQG